MKIKRIPITGEFKKALVAAHGCRCVNCGTLEDIEWHHIVPLSRGGQDVVSNIIPLCHSCHHKGAHGQNVNKENWGKVGRPRKTNRTKETDRICELYTAGAIENKDAVLALGYSAKCHLPDLAIYMEWVTDKNRNGEMPIQKYKNRGGGLRPGRKKKSDWWERSGREINGQVKIPEEKPRGYYSIDDVAKIMKVSVKFVMRYVKAGKLKTTYINGYLYSTEQDVENWFNSFPTNLEKRGQ